MIIRNGVRHNTSNFGGSGNANIVKLTQSEYDALPESKKSDGILYAITDGECSASGGSSKPVELTKAEYEALGDKVNSDGILYAITDGDGLSAKSMAFDDTETQLGVNNVQDAIVEQNKNLDELNSNIGGFKFIRVKVDLPSTGTWYYSPYPEGYNYENTFVVSATITHGGEKMMFPSINNSSYVAVGGVCVNSNGIGAYSNYSAYAGCPVNVLIARV